MEDRRVDKAIALHKEGDSCSSAVLAAFCEEARMTPEEARSVGQEYAGGRKKICGAVAAAKIVLQNQFGADGEAFAEELEKKFVDKNGSCMCREIRFGRLRTCQGCVKDAATFLSEMT